MSDKQERVDRVKHGLKRGREYFTDAAEGMEGLGDKRGAEKIRRLVKESVEAIPNTDPQKG